MKLLFYLNVNSLKTLGDTGLEAIFIIVTTLSIWNYSSCSTRSGNNKGRIGIYPQNRLFPGLGL